MRIAIVVIAALVGVVVCRHSGVRGGIYIVAHQDDDLLFMTPEVTNDVAERSPVTIVYLTAGDAGQGVDMMDRRETGVRAAYAFAADVEDRWEQAEVDIAGRSVHRARLKGAAVEVYFLRLPDGNLQGDGFGSGSLWALHTGAISALHRIDGVEPAGYDVERLVSALVALIELKNPAIVHTLEDPDVTVGASDFGTSTDHSDHVITGRLAMQASLRTSVDHVVALYRAYRLASDAATLTAEESAFKIGVFRRYTTYYGCWNVPDVHGCVAGYDVNTPFYGPFFSRMTATPEEAVSGVLRASLDGCVNSEPDGDVTLGPCGAGRGTQWTTGPSHALRDASNRCLQVDRDPGGRSRTVHAVPCTGAPEQRWIYFQSGAVRGRDGYCLQRSIVGKPLTAEPCRGNPEQVFTAAS